MFVKKQDMLVVLMVAGIIGVVCMIMLPTYRFSAAAIVSCAVFLLSMLMVMLHRKQQRFLTHRIDKGFTRLMHDQWRHYNQLEALLSLYTMIQPTFPLPPFRVGAVSPDLGIMLIGDILQQQPTYVLETGSGVSTLLIGYALKKSGHGHVTALEHDARYAARTRQLIEKHGLTMYVKVIEAPLTQHTIHGNTWQWYSLDQLDEHDNIDFIFIDGPPADIQPCARYPALPLLLPFLADTVTVLVDDTLRKDDKETLRRWRDEFNGMVYDELPCEKGAARLIFKRTPPIA